MTTESILIVSAVSTWLVLVTLVAGVLGLYVHIGRGLLNSKTERQNQGPKIGSKLAALLPSSNRASIVLFLSTRCALCQKLKGELNSLQADFAEKGLDFRVILEGDRRSIGEWAKAVEQNLIHEDPKGKLAQSVGIAMTPFAVAIDSAGAVVGKGLVNDGRAIKMISTAVDANVPMVLVPAVQSS